ncbi:aldehyde dehydrogenase family 3 member B1-like isoform X2 [Oppia nitens]|uniref:aldehyde dehydrogenase family 3 member B1-like isoform X2 n=1 Tax=Oppia nitens TaxID=1686743 RepID=UPI0023DA14BD|nr:aldehyde dehydrogenase family 3 member B1-like isoform X2 [Oppia nitens]
MSAIIEKAITRARMAFARNTTKSLDFRVSQLKALNRLLSENKETFVSAMKEDFKKPPFETMLAEVEFVQNDIKDQLLHIKENMKPTYVSKSIPVMMDTALIHKDPYGLVLIIGAWNYPIQLALCPLVGAISAGNCAIIKPSEISPNTANVLAELIPKYLDNECFHVITGGPVETQVLLKERFDYIFFTGSTSIGKIVAEAAAKHLTPLTLELGGKSPLYIDDTVPNLEIAWRRILWGKLLNAGQTCVAPDYILCTTKVQKTLINAAEKIIKEFYGEDPQKSPDFCRIVNTKHFERVAKLIDSSGKPVIGGQKDNTENYIAPTILVDVSPNDPIMSEEIFGPVLPIVNVSSEEEAINFINKGEKPLSLYLFSSNKNTIKKFLNETSSGSVCVNDCVFHLCVDTLPFGGVGHSGVGRYHGKYSFDTFTHEKSVLIRGYNPVLEALGSKRYPPYSDGKARFMRHLLAKRRDFTPKYLSHYVMCAVGAITVLAIQSFVV